jgi:hypothetical protein
MDYKVHMYESTTMYFPSSELGLPPPLPLASVPPSPPEPKGGHTRLRVIEWGSPNSDGWRKSFALCLLYGKNHRLIIELDLQSLFGLHVHSCSH